MTPRRKQLIPSSTQKSAGDELNTRETGMEYPVGSCTVLRAPLVIYFVKAAPHRCAWVTVIRMIAFLPHVWQEVGPLSSSRSTSVINQIRTR